VRWGLGLGVGVGLGSSWTARRPDRGRTANSVGTVPCCRHARCSLLTAQPAVRHYLLSAGLPAGLPAATVSIWGPLQRVLCDAVLAAPLHRCT